METSDLTNDGRLLHLRCDDLFVGLAPECGGSIAYLAQVQEGSLRHWFRQASSSSVDQRDGEMMACFPLVPVSGRVADAKLNWRSQVFDLPRNVQTEPNHLHGEGWQRPWQVKSKSETAATLVLEQGSDGWPFPYSASFNYALDPGELNVTMSVRNEGISDMPAAIGIHPWFPPPPANLRMMARKIWLIDERKLFVQTASPEPHRDFTSERNLAAADLEHGFSDWDGIAELRWPNRPGVLRIEASPELRHVVVYTKHPSGAFCVEPVSCSVDAFNLHSEGIRGTGTYCLAPGTELRAQVRFRFLAEKRAA